MLWLACTTPDPVDSVEEAAVDTELPAETVDSTPLEDTDSACVDARELSWSSFGHGFFRTWCTSCHSESSAERAGAPPGIDFDTEDQVATWSDAIRRTVIDDETMPLGGGVYDDDLELLDEYLRCGLGEGGDGGSTSEQPEASLSAEEVGAALDALLELGLPDAYSIAAQYMFMFGGRDNNCPGNDGYSLPGNFRGCTSNQGWTYAGVAGLDLVDSQTERQVDLWADCWIEDSSGDLFVGAGDVEYAGLWSEGSASWEAELAGTFGYEDADEPWMAAMPSLVAWTSGTYGSGWELAWSGSLSTETGAYYLQDGTFSSSCAASGTLMLRGEQGYWYTLALDGCDGCGTVSWGGQSLGDVCVALPAAGAELLTRSLPGEGA